MEKGLLQPIIVRLKDEKDSDYYYEIIAGYRRFEACRMLGLSKLMCHIIDADDKEAYEISLLFLLGSVYQYRPGSGDEQYHRGYLY
jgi:ParB family chromosome partitioning protein